MNFSSIAKVKFRPYRPFGFLLILPCSDRPTSVDRSPLG